MTPFRIDGSKIFHFVLDIDNFFHVAFKSKCQFINGYFWYGDTDSTSRYGEVIDV